MTKEKLLGGWQLVSFKAMTGEKLGYPLGEKPGGFIGFTPARFWVMIVDSTRQPPAATAMTEAEAASAMKTSVSYTGKYDVDPAQTPDGIKLVIHVDAAANQAIVKADRTLFMRVDENRLIVKSPAIVVPSTGQTSVVQLEFTKAD
jgi:lipocalin-like protein